MPSQSATVVERRATYVGLMGLFLSLFSAFMLREERDREEMNLRPFDLAMLGLATFRLGRLVSYDKVMETYRAPFTETVPDETGAGQTTVPKGKGVRRAIGELISCPICSGTWISAGLVYGLGIAPRPTRALLAIMSSIGIAELLNDAAEAMQWNGYLARKNAGQ